MRQLIAVLGMFACIMSAGICAGAETQCAPNASKEVLKRDGKVEAVECVKTDAAGTVYPVHTHDYPEVRVVVRGYLRVGLPESGEEFTLGPGDRLDLPADTPHWADVGEQGPVVYLSASNNGHTSHKR